MHRLALAAALAAPDPTPKGPRAGKPITFSLADARKKGPVVLYFFPAADNAGCHLEARLFAEATDGFKAPGAAVIGVTSGNLDKLAAFSADTEKCSGKFPVAADPNAVIAGQYDSKLAIRPGLSDRTSYVISPAGEVVHAYSNLNANDHVTETMTAVKAWRAKHPKK